MSRTLIPLLACAACLLTGGAWSGCVLAPIDASGRACDVEGACGAGFTCVEGACEQVCAVDDDCPAARRCTGGACLVVVALDGGASVDGGDGGADDEDAGVVPVDDAGPGRAPTAEATQATTPADTAVVIPIPAADADGDALAVVVVRPPVHGKAEPGAPGSASLRYDPDDGFAGFDTIAVQVSDGALSSAPVEVIVQVVGRSCAHVVNAGGSVGDGVYLADLTPGDGVADEDPVFCDMTTASGGWSLALKVDGTALTFCFDAPLWTDDVLLNEASVDETPLEAKLAPYVRLPASELLVAMDEIGDAAAPPTVVVVPLAEGAASLGLPLGELIALETPQDTELEDEDWQRALFPDDGARIHDGAEGINATRGPNSGARIGQLGEVCCNETSSLGVGLRAGGCAAPGIDLVTAGARIDECCGGPIPVPVDARVSVRSRDFTFLPAAPSCADHAVAGRFLTGTYLLDADGPGGAAAQPASCALGDLRPLVVFERDGVLPDDPCPPPLVENPDGIGCVRGAGVEGAVSVVFASPVPIARVRGRVEAIARGAPDAFAPGEGTANIDNVYVDGVAVSVGTPRVHVFTFAAGTVAVNASECTCADGEDPPAFVGAAHLCEELDPSAAAFDEGELLFDFEAVDAACTQPETPNAFDVVLAEPNEGPVEVRLMLDDDDADEDIALTRLELFVQ